MTHAVLRIESLPSNALDAAQEFHMVWLAQARALLESGPISLAIVLPPAAYDHADWRRAAARDLARAASPIRVNLIASDGTAATDSVLGYLQNAPGVTGQFLPLDSSGAGSSSR
jgi:hypothetical protein